MIDLNNLNKDILWKNQWYIEPSKIQIEDINNYVGVIDIENVFDKNIRIEGVPVIWRFFYFIKLLYANRVPNTRGQEGFQSVTSLVSFLSSYYFLHIR